MQATLQADQRPKQKPKNEILPAHPQELFLLGRGLGLMLNQEAYLETMMERLNSGELKTIFRIISCICHHWSDEKWKSSKAGGGGQKTRFQYCTDSSGENLYIRALQGHAGRSLIDPSLQDNVLIPDGFFKYIYHVGCAINLHSIIKSGLIPEGHNLSNRQYSFFLWIPWTKNTRILTRSTWEAPRLAQYMNKAWKKHQNTVYWVYINLPLKKGLKF